MPTVAQRRRWLVIAAFGLVLAWLLAPATIPIYNGIGNPDEPYRYVKPPSSAKTTKLPTSAHITVPVSGGFSGAAFANTGESGPQASLYLPPKALKLPTGATSASVTVQPAAPSSPLPTDGTIFGNVYAFDATANGQSLGVVGSGPSEPSLQMRAPDGSQPGPVFEHRSSSGTWTRMRTTRIGVDIYQARVPTLGDWALVRLSSDRPSGGGLNWALLGPGIALLVVAILVLIVRLRRTGGLDSDG